MNFLFQCFHLGSVQSDLVVDSRTLFAVLNQAGLQIARLVRQQRYFLLQAVDGCNESIHGFLQPAQLLFCLDDVFFKTVGPGTQTCAIRFSAREYRLRNGACRPSKFHRVRESLLGG